jgi:deazaflavin-dependent oxidoreductase (nitroreductase family)
MYPGGRPNHLARLLNRCWAFAHETGFLPKKYVTLEVPGRRTGRPLSFPLVMTHQQGERYLVSMFGEDSNWVRNVRAAGGRAVLRRGRREPVQLEEVDPNARAPIVRRYLSLAPGPGAFIPVDRDAPLAEFEKVAPQIPVFRVTTDRSARNETRALACGATRADEPTRTFEGRRRFDMSSLKDAAAESS